MNEDAAAWKTALKFAMETSNMNGGSEIRMIQEDGSKMVAAVCIRDHFDELGESDRQWCISTLVAEVERNSGEGELEASSSINQTSPVTLAAAVLPKVLAHEPNDGKILQAVGMAVTHASEEVSISASTGVANYLHSEHRDLLLRCAGGVSMLSNLLVKNEQRQIRRKTEWLPGEMNNIQGMVSQTREAFVQGSIDAVKELKEVDLTTRHGRYASTRILLMLANLPELDITRDLFIRTCQEFVKIWTSKREMRDTDDEFNFSESKLPMLARIILTLPSHLALLYCSPFLDAVDTHPDGVSHLVEWLVIEEDKHDDNTCFWDIWQAFADRIVDSRWACHLNSSNSTGANLVAKMMLNLEWKQGTQSWHRLVGHEEMINRLVARLPPVQPVFSNLAHYIYHVGESSLPRSFVTVAELLQKGDVAALLSSPNTVSYLAATLQRYVYGNPAQLKTVPRWRTAVIETLDQLVEAGSSVAYKMRDDFVTPDCSSY